MIPRDRIIALVQPRQPDDARPQRVPYPRPDQVLYAGPNPDGSRKMCGNCAMFINAGACTIVGGPIDPGQVCGYHVFGAMRMEMPDAKPDDAATKMAPAVAGLIDTPLGLGTSCDGCRFFDRDRDPAVGLCAAVGAPDGMPPVVVDALGCCARWEVAASR